MHVDMCVDTCLPSSSDSACERAFSASSNRRIASSAAYNPAIDKYSPVAAACPAVYNDGYVHYN